MAYNNKYQVRKEKTQKVSLYGTAYYASVLNPIKELNTKEGKVTVERPYYKISLGLSAKGLEYADKHNLVIQSPNDNIPLPHVNIYRNWVNSKGDKTSIQIVSTPDSGYAEGELIGNGSNVKVTGFLRPRQDGKNQMDLLEVEVSNHKPYVKAEARPASQATQSAPKTQSLNDEIPF